MAEKTKKLRKILERAGLKGQLKQVANLEEAHIILLTDPLRFTYLIFVGKDDYMEKLERGEEDEIIRGRMIFYLVSANPRNRRNIEQRLLTNKFGMTKSTV